ncbi:hypothetical protein [Alkalihalobacillus sp. AL-G]|uniref:hypothetical protein n=1 Tax=Alkalihalobacillus sp. AL-G TaxID=2926399 RepID=UPI00272A0747|nr:hypothetical protein [Alkalihalobacillus sp. AL-G]WLD92708.1 hypothetical protein MOJ78_17100 [Alkalihalobacillus sp. AL-G]
MILTYYMLNGFAAPVVRSYREKKWMMIFWIHQGITIRCKLTVNLFLGAVLLSTPGLMQIRVNERELFEGEKKGFRRI